MGWQQPSGALSGHAREGSWSTVNVLQSWVLPGHGYPGLRWLRLGGCTPYPPPGRSAPASSRARRTDVPPRTSAMAGGVGEDRHLHESIVTGGHDDDPDNFTPLILASADRSFLSAGIPPGRCAGGRAQPAPAHRRSGIGCTGRSGPPPLPSRGRDPRPLEGRPPPLRRPRRRRRWLGTGRSARSPPGASLSPGVPGDTLRPRPLPPLRCSQRHGSRADVFPGHRCYVRPSRALRGRSPRGGRRWRLQLGVATGLLTLLSGTPCGSSAGSSGEALPPSTCRGWSARALAPWFRLPACTGGRRRSSCPFRSRPCRYTSMDSQPMSWEV